MHFDYSVLKEHKLYSLIKAPLWLASHAVYKYRCKGKENIPETGSLIIACNHVAFSDPALIVANCPRKIHYMAKSDLFENPAFAALLRNMNAFPVRRWTADRDALRYARRVLECGGVLGIFPEGRRVRGEKEPVDARNGIGYLARITGSDILPCCIYKINKKHRSEITVVFGTVIRNSQLGFTGENRSAEIRNASKIIMDRIKELWKLEEIRYRQRERQDSASE